MRAPAGFELNLWAAEPMLANPVAFSIDEKGRVFVAETHRYRSSVLDIRHYMFMLEDDLACRTTGDRVALIQKHFPSEWQNLEKEPEVVRLVEDRDGDGKADFSAPYFSEMRTALDGINSGVLAHGDKVWCTNIPNLWLFEGTSPEGKALKQSTPSTGYGVRFSFTGHDMHGLIMGPDGRLYFTFGDRGATVQTAEGKTLSFPDEGAVFRCEQDGTHLEPYARGLRNPQELAFDNHGNLFTGDNDSDQGDRERWVYVVEGGDSGWRVGWQHNPLGKQRNPWLALKMWEPRAEGTPFFVNSPIVNIPDGPSGVAHYPGTGLPAEYDDHFFICGFKGSSARSSVSMLRVAENGAGFSVVNPASEFLGSVQATDIAFGPDSNLYFSEWGEGWEGSGRGRIFTMKHAAAQKEQSARVAEVKTLLSKGFSHYTNEELVGFLGHLDQRIRLEAQWTLAARPEAAPLLAAAAASRPHTLTRIHALWGLGHLARLAHYKTPGSGLPLLKPIVTLLQDKDPEVRAQTAKALGDGRVDDAFDALVAALHDQNLRVQFFAAQSLGKLGRKEASASLFEVLKNNADKDPFLVIAVTSALESLNDSESIAAAIKDPSKSVRLGSLLTLRKLRDPQVARFLTDTEPLLVREAALAINDESITAAYAPLSRINLAALNDEQLALRVLNSNYRLGEPSSAQTLASVAANPAIPEPLRVEALNLLGNWAKPAPRDRVTGNFSPLAERSPAAAVTAIGAHMEPLLAASSSAIVAAAIDAVTGLDARSAEAPLTALATNKASDPQLRTKALEALGALKSPSLKEALRICLGDTNPGLRISAVGLLGSLDPEEAAKQLSAAFEKAAVQEKKTILAAMATLATPEADASLALWLVQLKEGRIEPAVQLELLEAAAKSHSVVVKEKVAAYTANLSPSNPLAAYDVILAGGDRKAGEKLFKEHAVAACLRCHKVSGSGGEAGPDLTGIASRKDRRYLMESILAPNAQIAEGFQSVLVTLKNGEMVAGMVRKDSTSELVLQIPAPGVPPTTVKKADIKSRDNAPSGMPSNMADLLTKRELRDILEYVASLNTAQ